jgi:hypothetical protein
VEKGRRGMDVGARLATVARRISLPLIVVACQRLLGGDSEGSSSGFVEYRGYGAWYRCCSQIFKELNSEHLRHCQETLGPMFGRAHRILLEG